LSFVEVYTSYTETIAKRKKNPKPLKMIKSLPKVYLLFTFCLLLPFIVRYYFKLKEVRNMENEQTNETKAETTNGNSLKQKKGVNKTAVILGTVLIVGGLIFAREMVRMNRSTAAQSNEIPPLSVRTSNAETRTLRAYLDVNGEIVSAQQVEVFPDAAGRLLRLNVTLGTWVSRGDVIGEVDPSRPGTTFMASPIHAPISGTVSRIPISVGATVSTNTSITAISVIDNIQINAFIPEREISGLSVGLKADVTLQAYPGVIFPATITHVSPILDSASRSKLITLRFDQNDRRINAGMFARIRLNTRTYENVLTIPAEAIVSKHGESNVFILHDNEAGLPKVQRQTITTGVTLSGWTEITSGLSEGSAVVIQGQQLLSGGETVRVIGGN
jgi:multidrug efflux pump subunit AcrA (membrane-fusion protein)